MKVLKNIAPFDKGLPIEQGFIDGVANAFELDRNKEGFGKFISYNTIWRYKPVDIKTFCDRFLDEPLWEKQQVFCDRVFGDDPMAFRDLEYNTGLAFWGKGSGKDRTIAKIFTYWAYLLCCLNEPQELMGLSKDSPLDMINVASSSEQAKDVFFVNLKALIRRCIDPDTGQNWFATKNWFTIYDINDEGQTVVKARRYMDLREERDIQKRTIDFGNGIKAYSGNSKTYQGEGKNLILVAFDELGAFDPIKALGDGTQKQNTDLWGSLQSTVISRSPFGLVIALSYKYDENCPMSIVFERAKKEKRTFSMRCPVWEVNPKITKQTLAEDYLRNPESAMMRYECRSTGVGLDRFIRRSYIIEDNINFERENPVIGNKITINNIGGIKFKPFFKGKPGNNYTIHIDAAKGKIHEGGDACGFTLAHPVLTKPIIDERIVKDTNLDLSRFKKEQIEDIPVRGVYIDLFVQLVADPGSELILADIRSLIYFLKKARKFNIRTVTVDGWQSVDTIQQLNRKGYRASLLSVDKNTEAYDTLKELEYQTLVSRYKNSIYEREMLELEVKKNKIVHPELSQKRAITEGVLKGSKDVSDSVAGACLAGLQLPIGEGGIAIA